MPDDLAQPFDGLARWLSDDAGDSPSMPTTSGTDRDGPRQPSPRRRARAAVLVAPWVIVVVMLAASLRTTGTPATTPSTAPSTAGMASPAGVAPPPPAGAGATATRLVRDAVTGHHAGRSTAIDVAVPEAPRWLGSGLRERASASEPAGGDLRERASASEPAGGDLWLVRVHAVVLHGDARRWRSATHEIWAVPLGVHAGRLVGLNHPWRVATDDARIAPAHWEPAAIDEAAVRSVLRAVGTQPADDLHAEQHPEIAGIIRVRVAGGAHGRHVWLGTTPTVRVLGAPPAAPAERPAAMPTERPGS